MNYRKIAKVKLFKAILTNTFLVSLLLFIGVSSFLEYNKKGYIMMRWHVVYGNDAKFISFMLLTSSSLVFCYYLFSVYQNFKNSISRKKYLESILSNETHICIECEEGFFLNGKVKRCPYCKSENIDYYKGFYERHPEIKSTDKKNITAQSSDADSADNEVILVFVVAIIVALFAALTITNYINI